MEVLTVRRILVNRNRLCHRFIIVKLFQPCTYLLRVSSVFLLVLMILQQLQYVVTCSCHLCIVGTKKCLVKSAVAEYSSVTP
jgi:hypothetical protein